MQLKAELANEGVAAISLPSHSYAVYCSIFWFRLQSRNLFIRVPVLFAAWILTLTHCAFYSRLISMLFVRSNMTIWFECSSNGKTIEIFRNCRTSPFLSLWPCSIEQTTVIEVLTTPTKKFAHFSIWCSKLVSLNLLVHISLSLLPIAASLSFSSCASEFDTWAVA